MQSVSLKGFRDELEDWLVQRTRSNVSIYGEDDSPIERVYLRRGHRYINRSLVSSLELGSISIKDLEQRLGWSKKILSLLDDAARRHGFDVVLVESVLNDDWRKATFTPANGWQTYNQDLLTFWYPLHPQAGNHVIEDAPNLTR